MESHCSTIAEAIAIATHKLSHKKIDNPHFEAKLLMQHCLQVRLAYLIANNKEILSSEQLQLYLQWVARRATGEPIAYIVGSVGFWNLTLSCNNSTLIPRADTESLVEWALSLHLPENASVLDLGTGTGAIALALKKEKPGWQITGVDVVPEAIKLAEANAKSNSLSVPFLESNWFSNISKYDYDLIVSNPPYVEEDSKYLTIGDLQFEPRTALVAADHGMHFLRIIVKQAKEYLKSGGWLLLEHGFQQSEKVATELDSNQYKNISSKSDINGINRVTGGQVTIDY